MLFFACGRPILHLIYEGEDVSHIIQDGRLLLSSPRIFVQMRNTGQSNLEITSLVASEDITCVADIPIVLRPNQDQEIMCTYTPTETGEYTQEIRFLGNTETKKLTLEGTITPYIQYKPQELSLVDDAFAL